MPNSTSTKRRKQSAAALARQWLAALLASPERAGGTIVAKGAAAERPAKAVEQFEQARAATPKVEKRQKTEAGVIEFFRGEKAVSS